MAGAGKLLTVVGNAHKSTQDCGSALIVEVPGEDGGGCGQFVRVQSWCECPTRRHHPEWMVGAEGKKFRVTVEEIA